MKVPKIIHQLWIGDAPMPINAMNSVKNMNPDYRYMFWCEKTIEDNLEIKPRYQRKIDEHSAIWGKADLYRYIILEKYGGIFIDADMVCICPFDDFLLNEPFFCWENEISRPNLCATSLQAYSPNHIIPQTAIEYVLNNNVSDQKIPSWQQVGPGLLTKTYWDLIPDKSVVKVMPSYLALPDHHTGSKYKGHGKVYMTHEWGSTKNNYNEINNMKIPFHHTLPTQSIDITIPDNVNKKSLKEIMNGIKNIEGHFKININYNGDIKKYLNSTRFIFHKGGRELTQEELLEYNDNLVKIPDFVYYDENGRLINHIKTEDTEQRLSQKYTEPDDIVLELGARYGTISCLVNKIIKDKKSHYVVEPDKSVWEALENNMKNNDCNFNIIKGIIGKNKYRLEGQGYAKHAVVDSTYGESQIEMFDLPDIPFNTLIADCEGYLETFFNENKELFKNLKKIIMECDMPDKCDYDKLLNELINNYGFKIEEHVIEYGLNFFVLKK